jgi:hypothetical protein
MERGKLKTVYGMAPIYDVSRSIDRALVEARENAS